MAPRPLTAKSYRVHARYSSIKSLWKGFRFKRLNKYGMSSENRNVGRRLVKVANCSGYHGDPAYELYRQAMLGDVDFITGDYLADYQKGEHPCYEETAWEGIKHTIGVISANKIKVVIIGRALNSRGLALKEDQLVRENGFDLKVAFLSGDDLHSKFGPNMPRSKNEL